MAKISARSIKYSFKIQSFPKALPHVNDLIAIFISSIVIELSSSGDLSFKQSWFSQNVSASLLLQSSVLLLILEKNVLNWSKDISLPQIYAPQI